MKKCLALLVLCAVSLSLMAARFTHKIVVKTGYSVEMKNAKHFTKIKNKKGEINGGTIYIVLSSEESETKEYSFVAQADGEVRIFIGAPNSAISEFTSLKINGEEKLTEPLTIEWIKGVNNMKEFRVNAEKDKEIVISVTGKSKK